MDLGNQGATNVDENVRYIHTTRAIVTINVGLAQAHSNNNSRAISQFIIAGMVELTNQKPVKSNNMGSHS